jgi:hypothetical protein
VPQVLPSMRLQALGAAIGASPQAPKASITAS